MARHGKKLRKRGKAKKPSAHKSKHKSKHATKNTGVGKSSSKAGKKKAGKAKNYMTVADLRRELKQISRSLAALNVYFAKFPDPPAAGMPGGDIEIGPQAIGDQCAPRLGDVIIGGPQVIGDQCGPLTDGPGIGTPQVIGDQCAPPDTQAKAVTNWYVFKRTLAKMQVMVTTLLGMLEGMDPKIRI